MGGGTKENWKRKSESVPILCKLYSDLSVIGPTGFR